MEVRGYQIGDLWVLECSECGPLGVCSPSDADTWAISHARDHYATVRGPSGR